LRLANKLDRLLENAEPWAIDWCLNYLWAKYRLRSAVAVRPGVPQTGTPEAKPGKTLMEVFGDES
jgi:hypothetical protein